MTDEPPERPKPPKRKVQSSRVTAKGGAEHATKSGDPGKRGASAAGSTSGRYTPRSSGAAQLPSPWWVPALMFGLLVAGAVVIVLNYLGVLGGVSNVKLVIGLVLILGGIITATQYR